MQVRLARAILNRYYFYIVPTYFSEHRWCVFFMQIKHINQSKLILDEILLNSGTPFEFCLIFNNRHERTKGYSELQVIQLSILLQIFCIKIDVSDEN